jgi:hypothetical protein
MDTKKLGCTATLGVKCIKYYPDFTLPEDLGDKLGAQAAKAKVTSPKMSYNF